MEEIILEDKQAMIFLNNLGSSTFDPFWILVSEKWFWIPLYVIFLYFLYKNFNKKSLNAFLQRISVIAQKIKSLTGKAKLPFLITYRGLVNKYYNLVITRMKNKNSQDPQIKVKEEELKAKLSNIDEKINIAKGKVETTSDTTKTNPTQNNVQSKAPTVPTPASV
jgi:hypothetical protein